MKVSLNRSKKIVGRIFAKISPKNFNAIESIQFLKTMFLCLSICAIYPFTSFCMSLCTYFLPPPWYAFFLLVLLFCFSLHVHFCHRKIIGFDKLQGTTKWLPQSFTHLWDPFIGVQIRHLHHPYHIWWCIMICFHKNVLLLIPIVFLSGWWHIGISMCVFKLHM